MRVLDSISKAASLVTNASKVVADAVKLGGDLLTVKADLVEDLSDALGLPEWCGDLASLAVNYQSGNFLGMAEDLTDLLEDLSPPNARTDHGPGTFAPSASPGDVGKTSKAGRADAWVGRPAEASTTSRPDAWAGRPPEASGSAPTSAAGEGSRAGEVNGAKGGKKEPASKDKVSSDEAKKIAQTFMAEHSDPQSFMQAIRNGDVPAEIFESPGAMLMFQTRMQAISQANELMTNMTKAMHDMEMAIVRNMRA